MTRRTFARAIALWLVLAGARAGGPGLAQQSGAPPPTRKPDAPPAQPSPRRGPPPPPMANICSTEPGWCHLAEPLLPGAECRCLVPPTGMVRGIARFFPTTEPPSPYLRPHTGPPGADR